MSLHDASSVVKEAISKAEDLKSELIMLQVGRTGRGRGDLWWLVVCRAGDAHAASLGLLSDMQACW